MRDFYCANCGEKEENGSGYYFPFCSDACQTSFAFNFKLGKKEVVE